MHLAASKKRERKKGMRKLPMRKQHGLSQKDTVGLPNPAPHPPHETRSLSPKHHCLLYGSSGSSNSSNDSSSTFAEQIMKPPIDSERGKHSPRLDPCALTLVDTEPRLLLLPVASSALGNVNFANSSHVPSPFVASEKNQVTLLFEKR